MKKYFVKLLILLWLCQSPILGICQISVGATRPTRVQPSSSLIKCPLLSAQTVIFQQETNWCYAAATQMILQYYKKPIPTQCEIVKSLLRLSGSCPTVCNSNSVPTLNKRLSCDLTTWINYFKGFGFSKTKTSNINKDIIKNQLDSCHPVIALFNNGGNGTDCASTHAVVIIGYFEEIRGQGWFEWVVKDKLHFLVLDPKNECFGCEYFVEFDTDFRSVEKSRIILASSGTQIITFN
jgi:hypothetical protein